MLGEDSKGIRVWGAWLDRGALSSFCLFPRFGKTGVCLRRNITQMLDEGRCKRKKKEVTSKEGQERMPTFRRLRSATEGGRGSGRFVPSQFLPKKTMRMLVKRNLHAGKKRRGCDQARGGERGKERCYCTYKNIDLRNVAKLQVDVNSLAQLSATSTKRGRTGKELCHVCS